VPSTFVPIPLYPTVPPLPGVPPLPVPIGGVVVVQPPLVFADTPFLPALATTSLWGIWGLDGTPVLLTDATFSVEYSREYSISDYPQVSGAFQSYNKVQHPFDAHVEFLISAARVQFLQNVEQAVASLALVTVVTPEIQYPSANLTRYGFRREASAGVTLIRVEVWCREVRITAGAALSASTAAQPGASGGQTNANIPPASPVAGGDFSNAQSPNAAPQADGTVQPQATYTNPNGGTFDAGTLTPPT
jgi:hypothetical protein